MRPLILALALLTAAPAARAECWMKPAPGLGGMIGEWLVFTEHGNYSVIDRSSGNGNSEGIVITPIRNGPASDKSYEFPGLKLPDCKRLPE